MKNMTIKMGKTPKKLSLKCWRGYAYGYQMGDVEFIVMAASRRRLRQAYVRMSPAAPIDLKLVKKAIIVGVK